MSIVQPGLLLALCAPFVVAIWIACIHRPVPANRGIAPFGSAEAAGFDPAHVRFGSAAVDLESVVREAAIALDAVARAHWVRIELAVIVAMPVHVDPGALRKALRETMLIAIRAAPGGQVLVTALTLGSQLHIRITDDGLGADQRDREMLTRSAEASIALQGGSIAVEVRPGHGTMVTVRLPLPGKAGEDVYVLKQLPVLAAQAA